MNDLMKSYVWGRGHGLWLLQLEACTQAQNDSNKGGWQVGCPSAAALAMDDLVVWERTASFAAAPVACHAKGIFRTIHAIGQVWLYLHRRGPCLQDEGEPELHGRGSAHAIATIHERCEKAGAERGLCLALQCVWAVQAFVEVVDGATSPARSPQYASGMALVAMARVVVARGNLEEYRRDNTKGGKRWGPNDRGGAGDDPVEVATQFVDEFLATAPMQLPHAGALVEGVISVSSRQRGAGRMSLVRAWATCDALVPSFAYTKTVAEYHLSEAQTSLLSRISAMPRHTVREAVSSQQGWCL